MSPCPSCPAPVRRRRAHRLLRGPSPVAALLVALTGAVAAQSPAASDGASANASPWTVVGQQGLVRFVVVPVDQARDRAAYAREITRLCEPERTCFLNFYTNSQGLPAVLPLPDGIEHEATATFRRSMKNGAERFWWSCRLGVSREDCF